jgi:hypothetical protein
MLSSQGSQELSASSAIFDVGGFFPEIDPVTSTLDSPIITLLEEIRRKNIAAAAASNAQFLSIDESTSDPWDSLDDANKQQPWSAAGLSSAVWTCTCQRPAPTRESGGLLPPETEAATFTDACLLCGKKKQRDARKTRSISYATEPPLLGRSNFNSTIVSDPHHALAMLQATPQLRILRPASVDMNVAGKAGDRNILFHLWNGDNKELTAASSTNDMEEYKLSLVQDRANQQAASQLASLLWILSHEMSLEDYGIVESEVFSSVFGLVHSTKKEKRMAGLACVDALLAVPSADEEKKAIKFANTLSTGLRAANGDYEFLNAVSRALGHMARRTANVDFVESEVTRALEWLRTERSERR